MFTRRAESVNESLTVLYTSKPLTYSISESFLFVYLLLKSIEGGILSEIWAF